MKSGSNFSKAQLYVEALLMIPLRCWLESDILHGAFFFSTVSKHQTKAEKEMMQNRKRHQFPEGEGAFNDGTCRCLPEKEQMQ